MATYIFGYGTLMNAESRHRTYKEIELYEQVRLSGYSRILNACHKDFEHAAMNLVECENAVVEGVVTLVSDEDLQKLADREVGYELVEVTQNISLSLQGPVFTYINRNPNCVGKKIDEDYLERCLVGVPEEHHERWLEETIIPDVLEK